MGCVRVCDFICCVRVVFCYVVWLVVYLTWLINSSAPNLLLFGFTIKFRSPFYTLYLFCILFV